MEASPAMDYQSSQLSLFMAGITTDLDEHVITKSAKYAFDFEREKPLPQADAEFHWFEASQFSKSELTGKKPRINVFNARESTADTDMFSARGPINTSMISGEGNSRVERASSFF